MEAYFSETIISHLQNSGFTYFHGINERTSVFFNKNTGRFITNLDLNLSFENLLIMSDTDIIAQLDNLVKSIENEQEKSKKL